MPKPTTYCEAVLQMEPGNVHIHYRSRLKIQAAIENAKAIKNLQRENGSFKNWIDSHHPLTKDEWVKLFKKTFRFTGGEIVNEFLLSTGYLPGAHIRHARSIKKY